MWRTGLGLEGDIWKAGLGNGSAMTPPAAGPVGSAAAADIFVQIGAPPENKNVNFLLASLFQ